VLVQRGVNIQQLPHLLLQRLRDQLLLLLLLVQLLLLVLVERPAKLHASSASNAITQPPLTAARTSAASWTAAA
jgi:hypothetical protein